MDIPLQTAAGGYFVRNNEFPADGSAEIVPKPEHLHIILQDI
jgi:hypothetical protein